MIKQTNHKNGRIILITADKPTINDQQIAKELNERSRKTLNFLSPADKLSEVLQ